MAYFQRRHYEANDRRYTFKLYPTKEQAAVLHEQRRMMVDLWNALLECHESMYRRHRGQKGVCHRDGHAFYSFSPDIKLLRAACPEWKALSVWSAHEVRNQLEKAFQAFYRRAKQGAGAQSGYPRFRRRRDGMSIPHRHTLPPGQTSGSGSGCKLVHVNGNMWHLTIKGVEGQLHVRGQLPNEAMGFSVCNIDFDGHAWWLSVCAQMPIKERDHGRKLYTVTFDGLERLATVNGQPDTPVLLWRAIRLREHIDTLKSEHDRRWPRGVRIINRPADEQAEFYTSKDLIRRLFAKERRTRRECLHEWSTAIVARSSKLMIKVPPMRAIRSPRGDIKEHGAAVDPVSKLNRRALAFGIASATAMLKYKAGEAGIDCDISEYDNPSLAIGPMLVRSTKANRKHRRAIKRREPT